MQDTSTGNKKISAPDVFRLVHGGVWDLDRFMEWYQSVVIKEYSRGISEASENAYRNGGGYEF